MSGWPSLAGTTLRLSFFTTPHFGLRAEPGPCRKVTRRQADLMHRVNITEEMDELSYKTTECHKSLSECTIQVKLEKHRG